MPQLQASRLRKDKTRSSGFLSDILPDGSLQRHLVMRGLVPLIAMLIVVLIADYMVMPIVTRHGEEFRLPDLVGEQVNDAQIALENLDLTAEIASEEYAPGKAQGVILGQFPIGGTMVKSNRAIKFVVSLGQKSVLVPDIAGLSVRQARMNLETVGLIAGEITWAFSDTLPEKVVVMSYPGAGTELEVGTQVTLMVNRGRFADFTYMPDLYGLHFDEATQKLKEKQLVVGVITRRLDDSYLPQTVLEQSEPPGTELDPATEIDLVVSSAD